MRKFSVELSVIDPNKGSITYCLSFDAKTSGEAYTLACQHAIDCQQTIRFVQVWFSPDVSLHEVI